ncbi:MAG: 3-octaprenyl-4-hydroxybenzoate carboxy-lyase, partial [Betaproteobacteria bacterium SG8_41]
MKTRTKTPPFSKRRLIVAMTGATGSIYGIRILERLRAMGGWETHLI